MPDIEEAVKWYDEALGFKLLFPIMTQDRATMPDLPVFNVYPSSMKIFKVAFLSAGQGTALELFEFKEPKMQMEERYNFSRDFHKGGFYHAGISTDDVDGLVEKVVAHGGKRVGAPMPTFDKKSCYVEDKWGNIWELMDYTLEDAVQMIQKHFQNAPQ